MKSSIFKVQFDDSVKEYNKVDGTLAIAYFFYITVFNVLFGFLMVHTNFISQLYAWSKIPTKAILEIVLYIPVALIQAGPVFIILKCRKQSLKSIGLKKEKILKCILLGILFAVPRISLNLSSIMSSIKSGYLMNLPDALLTFAFNFLEIAFVEEIIFRGFIQTRIQGLIRSKWFSIILVGLLFSLIHIPVYAEKHNVSFVQYSDPSDIRLLILNLILVFLTHIYFVYLYTRDNNILAPVVAHTLVDFIPDLFFAM